LLCDRFARGEATAHVFLSYARSDIKKAKRLADLLTSAGHSVWWDFQIDAGARFGDAINAALNDADAVIVLWSRASVESSWVLDEAAAGRDSNRLIPVLIEEVEPPLGFRQYQCISLIDWSGRGHPSSMPRILSTIATLGSRHSEPKPISAPERKKVAFSRRWATLIAFALAIAALAAIAWFYIDSGAGPPSVLIVPSASAPSQQSSALADELVLDLGRFQEGPLRGISIRQSDQRDKDDPDYRIEVGVRNGDNGELRGDASMLNRHHEILWATNVDVAASRATDLQQQLAAQIGSVLACSVRVPSMRPRPAGELLKLYLSGCASLYGSLGQPQNQTYNTFKQITVEQPDLADGWAGLAVLEAGVGDVGDPGYAATRGLAVEHLRRAKQLNPHLELVYAAETRLQSAGTNYAAPIEALERGVIEYPGSALLYYDLAAANQRIGRIGDSVDAAQNAFLLDPLSAGALSSYVYALTFSGNLEAAKKELEQAERTWPGSESIETTRYYFNLRYGDAAEASRVARDNSEFISQSSAQQALIAARISPTEANKDRAIAAFQAAYRSNPSEVLNLLQALGTFARVDEAFAVMRTAPTNGLVANSDSFFRPNMRSIRADVRFIAEANRLGLTRVWKQTGKWPDFCADPQLPYDCKKEAAKFAD
jgi:hypothetical protein